MRDVLMVDVGYQLSSSIQPTRDALLFLHPWLGISCTCRTRRYIRQRGKRPAWTIVMYLGPCPCGKLLALTNWPPETSTVFHATNRA